MSTGKIELSVGAVKYVDPNEIITEEEYNYIKNKIPELDERVDIVEDEIEEINSSLDNKTYYCTTISDMKNKNNLKNGDMVITLGYWSVGDGGNGIYNIKDNESKPDNGGSVILLNNGLKARLINNSSEINVKQFGVKTGRNSLVDCSDVINNIISEGEFTILYFPKGEYWVEKTIILSKYVKIRGDVDSRTISTYIQTACNEVFTTNEGETRVEMENIEFYGANNNLSILFSRVKFTDSRFINLKINNYHVVLNGSMYQLSKMINCNIYTIRHAGFTNVLPLGYDNLRATTNGITDSSITNCYFTGSHQEKASLFYNTRIASTSIINNYIDFFYSVFDSPTNDFAMFDGTSITNNTIEYCVYCVKTVRVTGCLMNNNIFKYIRINEAYRFSYLTDMSESSSDWVIIKSPRIAFSNICNNLIVISDNFINFDVMGKGVKITNNSYDSYIKSKVIFNDTNKWAGEGVLGCRIDDLDYKEVTEFPNPTWGNQTYPGHIVLYNNKQLININQKWYDYIGNNIIN